MHLARHPMSGVRSANGLLFAPSMRSHQLSPQRWFWPSCTARSDRSPSRLPLAHHVSSPLHRQALAAFLGFCCTNLSISTSQNSDGTSGNSTCSLRLSRHPTSQAETEQIKGLSVHLDLLVRAWKRLLLVPSTCINRLLSPDAEQIPMPSCNVRRQYRLGLQF